MAIFGHSMLDIDIKGGLNKRNKLFESLVDDTNIRFCENFDLAYNFLNKSN